MFLSARIRYTVRSPALKHPPKKQFVLLRHGRPLTNLRKNPRRNPAADGGGHQDGNINFRFFIECGLRTDTLFVQNYSSDTINPTNQALTTLTNN